MVTDSVAVLVCVYAVFSDFSWLRGWVYIYVYVAQNDLEGFYCAVPLSSHFDVGIINRRLEWNNSRLQFEENI